MRKRRLQALEQRSGYYCPHCQEPLQKPTIDLAALPHLDGRQLRNLRQAVAQLLVERGEDKPDFLADAGLDRQAWNAFVLDTLQQLGVPPSEMFMPPEAPCSSASEPDG